MKAAAVVSVVLFCTAQLQTRLFAAEALDPNLPTLRIVFFTPRDVSPPPGVEQRLTQVARYTENFFNQWMTHWNYEPARKQIFQWESDGTVEVLYAQGDKNADQYQDGSFRPAMLQKLIEKHRIPRNNNIWWIFVYAGDPPARFSAYRGAGDSKAGGWAILNYVSTPGDIRQDLGLAEGFHDQFMLKGAIHELGHGLGLPHLGPRLRQNLGNSLMGPVTRIWEQHHPRDQRGHLSEGSAAMLWSHPLFSGSAKNRNRTPKVVLHGFQARYDQRKQQITVQGRLESDLPAHSVVVVDDMDDKPGEYWKRAYVGRMNAQGGFQVVIDEPVPSGGMLRIVFCFENGVVTGNGQQLGLQGALEKRYEYARNAYRFD